MIESVLLTNAKKILNEYLDVLVDLDAQDLLHHVYDEDDGDIYESYNSTITEVEELLDQIDYLLSTLTHR